MTMKVDEIHVIPLGDMDTHTHDSGCRCGPIFYSDGEIYVHNAFDGREAYETGERKLH
jgi:hypothetical protein